MGEKNSYKVSVIVPVYGVERFVGRCMESLMNQTMTDGVEFIFVDDCSPDGSMDIVRSVIEKYPERKKDCRILVHSENRGLPAARNTGLAAAGGEYVCHFDSDDFMDPRMLELMHRKAKDAGVDMVWCDWWLSYADSERCMRQPDAYTGREALTRVLTGTMKYNVWNKMTRRALFTDNSIEFPAGKAMGEDMTMIRLMACAGTTARVAEPLYHYIRTNSGAMTRIYSDRHLRELMENVDQTIGFLKGRTVDGEIGRELEFFKLSVKLPFLFTGRMADARKWREWYPEADRFIMQNKAQPLRTRALQWFAARRMGWVNVAYTKLVFNFIYGMIFK